jgi:hypothetical protein
LRSLIKIVFGVALAIAVANGIAAASTPSVADLDAAARSAGNDRETAERIGRSVFATRWSAQVTQISANSLAGHLIVGVRLWGVKFHGPMTREAFSWEVVTIVERAFSAAPAAEEVDLWASVPIDVSKGIVVSGDLAKPTSRTVFSVTARRGETSAALHARIIGAGDGVFWDRQWAQTAFRESA